MIFLRNVLFRLSDVLLQRYQSADLYYTSGPTADDIQDDAIVPAAAVINVTVW